MRDPCSPFFRNLTQFQTMNIFFKRICSRKTEVVRYNICCFCVVCFQFVCRPGNCPFLFFCRTFFPSC